MSVKIRLRRMGAKKHPFYRIVVADSRSPRNGRFIESLGYYNPCTEPPSVKVDEEKVKDWVGKGAQATDTTRSILSKIMGPEIFAKKPKKKKADAKASQEGEASE